MTKLVFPLGLVNFLIVLQCFISLLGNGLFVVRVNIYLSNFGPFQQWQLIKSLKKTTSAGERLLRQVQVECTSIKETAMMKSQNDP